MLKKIFLFFLLGFSNITNCKIDETVLFSPKNKDFQGFTKLTEAELVPILNFLKMEEATCAWVPKVRSGGLVSGEIILISQRPPKL